MLQMIPGYPFAKTIEFKSAGVAAYIEIVKDIEAKQFIVIKRVTLSYNQYTLYEESVQLQIDFGHGYVPIDLLVPTYPHNTSFNMNADQTQFEFALTENQRARLYFDSPVNGYTYHINIFGEINYKSHLVEVGD